MTQQRIHRFDFGALRDFRGPIIMQTETNALPDDILVEPPAPAITAQDVEDARLAGKKQGYADGYTAGRMEAQKEIDQRSFEANDAIRRLSEVIGGLNARYQQLLVDESAQLSALVTAIAHKVAGEAMALHGAESIVAMVEQCLPVVFSKPKLVVDLNPEVFEHTLTRIEEMLTSNGVEAEIQFRANPELGVSDIHLDWGSGQMTRSADALWEEIRAIIERNPPQIAFQEPTPNEPAQE